MGRAANNIRTRLRNPAPALRAWLKKWGHAARLRVRRCLTRLWSTSTESARAEGSSARRKLHSVASLKIDWRKISRFGGDDGYCHSERTEEFFPGIFFHEASVSSCHSSLDDRLFQKSAGRDGILHRPALYLVFVFALALVSSAAFAQVSKEYQLKAVFLWRLAQFTQWPSDAFESAESPIVICVVGDNPFDNALHAAVAGETAHGRKFIVQQYRVIEQTKGCHIAYLAGAGPRQTRAITSFLGGRSVLTVKDVDGPATAYDTIVSFVTEQNKIKLVINVKAAAAARLVLDPRLLRSAEVVGD